MDQATAVDRSVEFRILGSLEVVVDGHAADVGGPRQRRLLALLLLEADRVVPADALVEWMWDDDERPDHALDSVRTYVSRLRRALATVGLDGNEVLRTEPPGYRFAVDRDQVDGVRFERLVRAGRSMAETGDIVGALAVFDQALALWRGRPYLEFEDRSWAEAEVGRLCELRTVAVEERICTQIELGAHAEAVGELGQLVAGHPLRARPVELLTLALYRSGRQAEALRVVDRYRSELAEAGLEPPSDITELEQRVQVDDPELRRRPRASTSVRGYELAEQIGEGASSVVFRAFQPSLGRELAVKQIRAELADRPGFIRRFEAEARTVAALEHPFIVPLYDYWREPGSAYLVMRWLRGGTLAAALEGRPLSVEAVSELIVQVGSALAAAHAADVIHGDVRAANIFFDDAGNHYLGDFGIALDSGVAEDISKDIRAFAVVVHEALTGQPQEAFPSVRRHRPDLPVAIDDVLAIAAGERAGDRYPSVGEFVDALLGALGGRPSPSRVVAERVVNPYKGLAAFEEHDAADFHGRDRLVDRIIAALEPGVGGRLVAVVGPSGSGKSSLVRAGLLPRLRAGAIPGSERWFVTSMVPGTDPFRELERALARVATTPTAGLAARMASTSDGIAAVVDAVAGDDTGVLLVIDQFEELYTHVDSDGRRQDFLDRLYSAVTADAARLRVVLTVRADFWDRPLSHSGLAQVLETAAVMVTPLAADELEAAITRPARRVGADLEPGLVSAVVADVHDRPGALPLLQYALTELFEHCRGRRLELVSYQRLGGVVGSLARRAEELYAGMSDEERAAARRVFSRLVAPGEGDADARRRVVRSELGASPAAEAVVERFGAARMLSFDRDAETREPTVEVAHEALLAAWPRLRGWIDDDRDAIRALRRLTAAASEWEESGRSTADLYRGTRLETVMTFADDHELTPAERDFLGASLQEADRVRQVERRQVERLRRWVGVAAAVAVLAASAGFVAFVQQQRADDNAARAESQRLQAEAAAQREADAQVQAEIRRMIAESTSLREDRPTVAMLLALEAHRLDPGPASLSAVLSSIQRTDGYLGFIPTSSHNALAQWTGIVGDEVLVVRASDRIEWFDLTGRQRIGSAVEATGPVGAEGSSAKGRFATTTAAGDLLTLQVGDVELTRIEVDGTATAVAVGEDGSLAVGYGSGRIEILGTADGETIEVGHHPHPIVAVDVDAERQRVASTDTYGNLTLWDATNGSALWTVTRSATDRWEGSGVPIGFDDDGRPLVYGVLRGPPPPPDVQRFGAGLSTELHLTGDGRHVLLTHDRLLALDAATGSVAWSLVGNLLVGQIQELDDGRILWGNRLVRDGVVDETLTFVSENVGPTTATGDGSTVVALGPSRDGLELWSTTGQQLIASAIPRGEHDTASVSADGTMVASFGYAAAQGSPTRPPSILGTVRDARTGDELTTDADGGWMISWLRDGGFMSYHIDDPRLPDRTIVLRDDETFDALGPPLPPQTWGSFELNPDRSLVAIGDIFGPSIRLFEVATGTQVRELSGPPFAPEGAATRDAPSRGTFQLGFSPDGRLLAASSGSRVVVWDADTWEPEHVVEAPAGVELQGIEFAPDSERLYIGSLAAVYEYDFDDRVLSTVFTGFAAGGVYHHNGLEATDDGERLVAAQSVAVVADAATGMVLGRPFPSDALGGPSVASGGQFLVTGTDEHLLVWDLRPETWLETACFAAGRNLTAEEWDRYGPAGEPYRATCTQWPALG